MKLIEKLHPPLMPIHTHYILYQIIIHCLLPVSLSYCLSVTLSLFLSPFFLTLSVLFFLSKALFIYCFLCLSKLTFFLSLSLFTCTTASNNHYLMSVHTHISPFCSICPSVCTSFCSFVLLSVCT
jgi:hypothetical protein